jgi:hypothetical protein
MKLFALFGSFLLCQSAVSAFAPTTAFARTAVSSFTASTTSFTSLNAQKGFSSEKEETKKPVKSQGQTKRDNESTKYDEIAGKGGNEYRIFVRQFGSDDTGWLPCGAIAVPRDAQVSDAIYANVEALKVAIVRTFPKLKGCEDEFEYGFNLKVYPDDPIDVAVKTTKVPGLSIGNWISTLLSPVDASKTPPPPPPKSD